MRYYFHNGKSAGEISEKEVKRLNFRGIILFPESEKDKHKLVSADDGWEYCPGCNVTFELIGNGR